MGFFGVFFGVCVCVCVCVCVRERERERERERVCVVGWLHVLPGQTVGVGGRK